MSEEEESEAGELMTAQSARVLPPSQAEAGADDRITCAAADFVEIKVVSSDASVIRRARVLDGLVTFRPSGSEVGLRVPVDMLGKGARLCVQGAWTPDEKCFEATEPIPQPTTGGRRR